MTLVRQNAVMDLGYAKKLVDNYSGGEDPPNHETCRAAKMVIDYSNDESFPIDKTTLSDAQLIRLVCLNTQISTTGTVYVDVVTPPHKQGAGSKRRSRNYNKKKKRKTRKKRYKRTRSRKTRKSRKSRKSRK